MPQKLVGITCSTTAGTATEVPRQFINRAYVRAIEQAGGVPILIPNLADNSMVERYLSVLDGLMLSGGVDVAPDYYGEAPHPELGEIDPLRDGTEMALAKRALESDMPVFAICRGFQLLNVLLGGTLYQDIPAQKPSDIYHRQSDINLARPEFCHSISIQKGSRLAEIVGSCEMMTNSFHHQALKDVAPGLTVTAHAPDGVIEAFESADYRYLVAVQFHPEETAVHDDKSHRLFTAFVNAL
jgi:putative glutamine amidotransferase